MNNIKKAQRMIDSIHSENQHKLNNLRNTESNICVCSICGHVGTVEEFTFSTGADDYDVYCPNCHADEKYIIDVDE